MAKYVLTEDFTQIAESAGTIVNISSVPAEISDSEESGTGIILFPRKALGFNKKIYAARAPGYLGNAIVATISTGVCCGQGSSATTVPSGTDTTTVPSGGFTDDDVEDVFGDGMGVFTPEDVDDVFDDEDFTAIGGFTPKDIEDVFDDRDVSDSGSDVSDDKDDVPSDDDDVSDDKKGSCEEWLK